MKTTIQKIIITALMLGSVVAAKAQIDTYAVWEHANALYTNGEYASAIAAYDSIVNEGYVSAKLYFNLGNAHFKAGQKGKAIANYHRAQRLAPADKDIAYNLAYANSFTKDKIDAVPQFFLARWFDAVGNLCGSNAWAIVSLVCLALTLAATLMYLLSRAISARKAGFCLAIIFLVFTVLTISFAAAERRQTLDRASAVVLSASAAVKSSPDRSSKDIFILHEGTMVKILNRLGEWCEIEIADGNEGWIANSAIEAIEQ